MASNNIPADLTGIHVPCVPAGKVTDFLTGCVTAGVCQEALVVLAQLRAASALTLLRRRTTRWQNEDLCEQFVHTHGDVIMNVDIMRQYRSQPTDQRASWVTERSVDSQNLQKLDVLTSDLEKEAGVVFKDDHVKPGAPSAHADWVHRLLVALVDTFRALVYTTKDGLQYQPLFDVDDVTLPVMKSYSRYFDDMVRPPQFVIMLHHASVAAGDALKTEDGKMETDDTAHADKKTDVVAMEIHEANVGDGDSEKKEGEENKSGEDEDEAKEEEEEKTSAKGKKPRKRKAATKRKAPVKRRKTKKVMTAAAKPDIAFTDFVFVSRDLLTDVLKDSPGSVEAVEKAAELYMETVVIAPLGPEMIQTHHRHHSGGKQDTQDESHINVEVFLSGEKARRGKANYKVTFTVDELKSQFVMKCPKAFVSKERTEAEALVHELRYLACDEVEFARYPADNGVLETVWGSGLELQDVVTHDRRLDSFAWVYPRTQGHVEGLRGDGALASVGEHLRNKGGYNHVGLQRDDGFPGSRLWGTFNLNEWNLRNTWRQVNHDATVPFVLKTKLPKVTQNVYHSREDYPYRIDYEWLNKPTLYAQTTVQMTLRMQPAIEDDLYREMALAAHGVIDGKLCGHAESLIQQAMLGKVEEAQNMSKKDTGRLRRSARVKNKKVNFVFAKSDRCLLLDGKKNQFIQDMVDHGDADELMAELEKTINTDLHDDEREITITGVKFSSDPVTNEKKKTAIEVSYDFCPGVFAWFHRNNARFMTEVSGKLLLDELDTLLENFNKQENKGHDNDFNLELANNKRTKTKNITFYLEKPAEDDRINLEEFRAALEESIKDANLELKTDDIKYDVGVGTFEANRWNQGRFTYDITNRIRRVDGTFRGYTINCEMAGNVVNTTEVVTGHIFLLEEEAGKNVYQYLCGKYNDEAAPEFHGKKLKIKEGLRATINIEKNGHKKMLAGEYILSHQEDLVKDFEVGITTKHVTHILGSEEEKDMTIEFFNTESHIYITITPKSEDNDAVEVMKNIKKTWEPVTMNVKSWDQWMCVREKYLQKFDSYSHIVEDGEEKTIQIFAAETLREKIRDDITKDFDAENRQLLKVEWQPGTDEEHVVKQALWGISPDYSCDVIAETLGVAAAELNITDGVLFVYGGAEQLEKARATLEGAARGGDLQVTLPPCCSVCYIQLAVNDSQTYRLQLCGHWYCLTCIEGNVRNFMSMRRTPITCVHEDCDEVILLAQLKEICDRTELTMNELFDYATKSYIASHRTIVRYCPTPDCPIPYCVKAHAELFQCPLCTKVRICACCQDPWHEGLSCSVKRALKAVESKVVRWIEADEANRKLCPKCHTGIEKAGGCNKMHCAQCDANICWVCLRTFPDANQAYAHINSDHRY